MWTRYHASLPFGRGTVFNILVPIFAAANGPLITALKAWFSGVPSSLISCILSAMFVMPPLRFQDRFQY
jgi:hypothetical protein